VDEVAEVAEVVEEVSSDRTASLEDSGGEVRSAIPDPSVIPNSSSPYGGEEELGRVAPTRTDIMVAEAEARANYSPGPGSGFQTLQTAIQTGVSETVQGEPIVVEDGVVGGQSAEPVLAGSIHPSRSTGRVGDSREGEGSGVQVQQSTRGSVISAIREVPRPHYPCGCPIATTVVGQGVEVCVVCRGYVKAS